MTTWFLPRRVLPTLIPLLLVALMAGCATNPVTGKKELTLISEDREIALGTQNYTPAQQSQGGPYTASPELVRYVRSVGNRLAKVSDRPNLPYEFTVLNNSVPNAWAMPGGKIAINRGLLVELSSEAELAAVLAHEIVHSAARHGAKSIERAMALQTGVMATSYAAQGHRDGIWAVAGANVAGQMTQLKYSRGAERESDLYGTRYMVRAGYNPKSAIALQETFLRLKNGKRSGLFEKLFSSHPPSEERIRNNKEAVADLPQGGFVGKQEYVKAMTTLQHAAGAYQAYDKGSAALRKGNAGEALTLARRASRIEPHEALFYGLQGDALAADKQMRPAIKAYNKAIRHNDNYFLFFLRRGQVRQKLGDRAGARSDLERSNALFPTAESNDALGRIALAQNRRIDAVNHFRFAAQAKSETGRAAYKHLAQLTMSDSPTDFLRTTAGIARDGRLVVSLHNAGPIDVSQVVIGLRQQYGNIVKTSQFSYKNRLPAGAKVQLPTELRPDLQDRTLNQVIGVQVLTARPL
jgi:predicted Zn-dependent protease